MNTIYKRSSEDLENRQWIETKHGSNDVYDAVSQMFILCGQTISALQKVSAKRYTVDSGVWENRLV
ncbi:MAG: hypothetical protein V4509_01670, partial [Patescibacteria group bacterium]